MFLRTLFVAGIFLIEKFRIKINYGLAHLLFKVAEYQFSIYAKRSCLKESFSKAKK